MLLCGQNLAEHLVSNTALNHVGNLVCSLHDPLPRLVDVLETFGLLKRKVYVVMKSVIVLLEVHRIILSVCCDLRQLLGDVPAHEHRLQVDPEVLNRQPLLDDLRGVGEFLHPQLDGRLERSIVPAGEGSEFIDSSAIHPLNISARVPTCC